MALTYNTFTMLHSLRRQAAAARHLFAWPCMAKFYGGDGLLSKAKSFCDFGLRRAALYLGEDDFVSIPIGTERHRSFADDSQSLIGLCRLDDEVGSDKSQQSLGVIKAVDIKKEALLPAFAPLFFQDSAEPEPPLYHKKNFFMGVGEHAPDIGPSFDLVKKNGPLTIQKGGHITKKRIFAKVFHAASLQGSQ